MYRGYHRNMISRLSRKILGLSIKPDSVSAVLVKSTLKGPWLEYSRHIPISRETVGDNDAIRSALQSIADEIDFKNALCTASYSFDHLSFRTLTVPFKEKKKIRQVLPFELESLLPFQPDDLVMDFAILENHGDASGADLIAAAIHKNELQTFLEMLQSAGLDPDSVTISGHGPALVAAAGAGDTAGKRVLLDIQKNKASVYIAVSGGIKTIRRFSVPGSDDEKASHIAGKLRHTLPVFEDDASPETRPWGIDVTGADAALCDLLEKELGTPVHPLSLIKDGNIRLLNPPSPAAFPPHLDDALALCLMEIDSNRGFNFRKGPFAPKNFWVEYTPDIIRSSVFAAVVLLLLFAGFITEIHSLGKKVDQVDHRIQTLFSTTFPDTAMTRDPLGQMKVIIRDQKKPALFDDETVSNVRAVDVINDISRLIPKDLDVVLTKVVISPGSVIVSGSTGTFNSVDDMKGRMEQAESFTAVTITSANLDRSGNRVDFKLKIQTR
jgi:general secretion pathway protein L